MTNFVGRWDSLQDQAPSIFGRVGLDVFSLTLGQAKHLPAEIAHDLSAEEAHNMVARLDAVGARTTAVLTSKVRDVRHRAIEVWPDRVARGFRFTEIDGMILVEAPLNARENLEYIRRTGHFSTRWRYERGANHIHADMSACARECVRQELRTAAKLEDALREAYPAARFVVSHIPGYATSFWQAADEGPDLSLLHRAPSNGRVWCQDCQRRQGYLSLAAPDAEFPQAEWGRCDVCGEDVLVRVWEILYDIGPGR